MSAALRVVLTPEMLVVVAVAFMHGTIQTMFRPLVAPYATSLGAGAFLAGLAVAAQSLPGLLFAVPAGSAIDRLGTGRILVAGGVSITAGASLLAAGASLPTLFFGMLLTGTGTTCIALGVQGLATAPVEGRGLDTRRVGGFGTFVLVGHLVGPTLGGVLTDLGGYAVAFWVVGLLGATLVLTSGLLWRARRPRQRGTDPAGGPGVDHADGTHPAGGTGNDHAGGTDPAGGTGDDHADGTHPAGGTHGAQSAGGAEDATGGGGSYRRAGSLLREAEVPAAVTVSALAVTLVSLRTSFLPLYLAALGWSASAIGLVLSAAAVTALVSRVAFPAVERSLRAKTLFRLSVAGGALALGAAVATASPAAIVVAVTVSGALLGTANPSTLTFLSRLVADSQRGLALGLRITGNRLAQSAGPVSFGAIAAVGGLQPAFFAVAASVALVCALSTRNVTDHR